ncbi:hypothetical protein BZL30_4795 [Mycobacterium kansasii]|uniref:Uncharacterized protein n=1 Tax=Mycobacterium kansasii TaxID=1768 RepID=A0A1V3X2L7_MYCKA|nr:hypothetical protein BZL30_4795 [Mycobacterium kansasii]
MRNVPRVPASPSSTWMSTTSVAPGGRPPGRSKETVTEKGVAGSR